MRGQTLAASVDAVGAGLFYACVSGERDHLAFGSSAPSEVRRSKHGTGPSREGRAWGRDILSQAS